MRQKCNQDLPPRPAARLLLFNQARDVLLFCYSTRVMPSLARNGVSFFWAPLGGALEPGESFEEAAVRELAEETGLTGFTVGPCVARREFKMELGAQKVFAVEHYFAIEVGDITPDVSGFTALEREIVLGWRWWSAKAVAASAELIFPEKLDLLLRDLDR